MNDTPRIYVACLSAYNNGHLHGEWIDLDIDADEVKSQIKTMLAASPMAGVEACEEWAIHDYEGFEGIKIDEYEDIDRLVSIAQKLKEHGEAFAAFIDVYSLEDIDDFEDKYHGCYASKESFAQERYEEDGTVARVEAAGLPSYYIDFEAIARDMFIDGYRGSERGYQALYVFSE